MLWHTPRPPFWAEVISDHARGASRSLEVGTEVSSPQAIAQIHFFMAVKISSRSALKALTTAAICSGTARQQPPPFPSDLLHLSYRS